MYAPTDLDKGFWHAGYDKGVECQGGHACCTGR